MRPLTMEETFIVTYICIILSSLILAFLIYWISEKNNKNKEK